jgi:hypothetical protein
MSIYSTILPIIVNLKILLEILYEAKAGTTLSFAE